ncbi:MAG TPA: DUF4126 domain-containing protein [Gaiellaceae bacterium]|nr:DUF4126 domain-containing protein [Gaiellaceae bacterium]
MDAGTAIGSVFAAFGLSGAAGLNAWLPLFAGALLDRLGVVELAEPFGSLSTNVGLALLAAFLVADFVGDKVPVVDHALHLVGTVVHPAAGAVLFTGQTGLETDIPTLVAVVVGALTAGSVHAGRASVRPAATATTAGLGNPVLSLAEDAASALLTLAAFALPALALVLVLALVAGLAVGIRRLRPARRRARRG